MDRRWSLQITTTLVESYHITWVITWWGFILVYIALPSACSGSGISFCRSVVRLSRGYQDDAVANVLLAVYPHAALRSQKSDWPLHGFAAVSLSLCAFLRPVDGQAIDWLELMGIVTGRAMAVYLGMLLLAVSRRTVEAGWTFTTLLCHELGFFPILAI